MSTANTNHERNRKVIDNQIKLTKVKRLAHHLSVGMSLIADATIRGSISDAIPVPASTQQHTRQWDDMYNRKGKITNLTQFSTKFNPNFLPLDDLRVWLGVAWHELGHALWSPFNGKVTITVGLNLLEDARIETLIILKYPKMKAAIQAMLAHLMEGEYANNTQDAAYSYAWVAGRSHLSDDARNEARKMLVKLNPREGRQIADQIDRIFREYLAMGSSLDLRKAEDLAHELNLLIGRTAELPNGKGCGTSMNDSGGDENAPDVDVPDDVLDNVGSKDEEPEEDDTDNAPGNATSDEGSTDSDEDSTASGASSKPATEASEELGERQRIAKEETDKLRDKVREELEESSNDMSKELEEEIQKLERVIDIVGGAQGAEIDVQVEPPTSREKKLASDISRVAAKFNDDSAKGLMRRRDHGRFKPNRFERFDDLDTAYDQWEPGLSQEMYIAMCIDISGSMESHQVTRVLYGLEVGLQEVATTDIALFNDTVRVPAASNSTTKQVHIRTHGGTHPSDALTYLYPRIRRAPQQNKLLVFYTDGIFSNGHSYEVFAAYINELKREGVNVRILVDPRADVKRIERAVGSLTNGQDLQVVRTVEELPDIVMGWTRSILSGSIV